MPGAGADQERLDSCAKKLKKEHCLLTYKCYCSIRKRLKYVAALSEQIQEQEHYYLQTVCTQQATIEMLPIQEATGSCQKYYISIEEAQYDTAVRGEI